MNIKNYNPFIGSECFPPFSLILVDILNLSWNVVTTQHSNFYILLILLFVEFLVLSKCITFSNSPKTSIMKHVTAEMSAHQHLLPVILVPQENVWHVDRISTFYRTQKRCSVSIVCLWSNSHRVCCCLRKI
jgi:hypothetical protein